MNEFELIGRFFDRPARNAEMAVGDDCARVLVAPGMELAVTTDMLVEGRHFLPDAKPRSLGHKALAVNLSDLAACGARPRWVTLAIALKSADEAWLKAFSEGFFALAERHGVDLVGGDTTRGPLTVIDVTALGEVPRGAALTRGGAKAGDEVWISGALGGAALALVHPQMAGPARRLHEPEPRVALGERLRGLASAAIDVSDGLAGDLGHILKRSNVGAVVEYAAIPRDPEFGELKNETLEKDCVLSGGDDYELLFTVPSHQAASVRKVGDALGLRATRIGVITDQPKKLRIVDCSGKPMSFRSGYDHFVR